MKNFFESYRAAATIVGILIVISCEIVGSRTITGHTSDPNYFMPTLPPRTISTSRRTLTCACEESDEPICANNGVTYKSQCNFDCAKRRNSRLRIVKTGSCGSITRDQYWKGGKKS